MVAKQFQEFQVLKPRPLIVKGKLMYHNATRSYAQIVLRKEIRDLFLDFDGDVPPISYQFEYYGSIDEIIERLRKLSPGALPFLMFLVKSNEKSA